MSAAGWIVTAAMAAAGLTAGCWVTMLAARVPRAESLRPPAGRCAACASPAGLADVIPLYGWMRLRRRCPECRQAFGTWYLAAALLTAAAVVAMWLRFGASPELPAFCYLAVVGVALAFIDPRYQRLPGLLGGYLLAAVTRIAPIATKRATRKSHLPFGPFMLAGALAVIVTPALSR